MKDLEKAWEQAWSLEKIDAHEEAGKNPQYIGSREKGNRIYDFFQDDQGHYGYRVRIRRSDGQAVFEEEGIFGHRIRHQEKKRKNVP